MQKDPIDNIRQKLNTLKLEAILVTQQANVAYLSGFQGEGQLIVTPTKKILLVDFRFKEQAEKETVGFQIQDRQSFQPLEKTLRSLVLKLRLKRLGFEPSSLSYGFYRRLKGLFQATKLIPANYLIEELRAIKTPAEINTIRQAVHLALKSLAFAKRVIKPGQKESATARQIYSFMCQAGADDRAFDIIVASGKRSALPHAPISHKIIRKGEAVLVDLGCRFKGYNSDLTRMLFLGKIRGKVKQIFEIVVRAQRLAIKAIRAGVRIDHIDSAARRYIAKAGYGAYFGHALGHGIGKEVHEFPPISPQNHTPLQENMVVTIEPAVYIPGWAGIRIEDMVLVTKTGCEVLTL